MFGPLFAGEVEAECCELHTKWSSITLPASSFETTIIFVRSICSLYVLLAHDIYAALFVPEG